MDRDFGCVTLRLHSRGVFDTQLVLYYIMSSNRVVTDSQEATLSRLTLKYLIFYTYKSKSFTRIICKKTLLTTVTIL